MHSKQSMRSPLAKVRGLGSAKDGTHHWWMQRLTAIALIPLGVWLASSVLLLLSADAESAAKFLAIPGNAIAFGLLLCVGLYHGTLGMQVIIEDYVHGERRKIALLVLIKLILALALFASLFAILKIALV